MENLEAQLLNANIVLMAAGAWFALWVLRKIWKGMDRVVWIRRLKPLYPAILCQGFVWIPGAMPGTDLNTAVDDVTIGARILTGLWCGFLASIGYQLLRRFLSNQGVDLPSDPKDLVPSVPPEPGPNSDDRDTPIETPIPKGDNDDGKDDDKDRKKD
jgi:hypothetical protein